MIRLIESGLFGNRLVAVDTPVMVERYNECLADIGLTATKLSDFHIDGWGWSPEIAEEQGNSFYLSHGLANPYGIIITPEQENASIYFPYQSFDWDVHKSIFQQYLPQITDITAQCGMWFEMNQEISAYRSPQDLLMIDVFTLQFHTVDKLMKAARSQRELIQRFNDVPNAWADEELRNKIIQSSQEYGDLRYRAVDVAPIPFGNFNSFYTLAFNGLYVFKNLPNGKPLLVYGNNSSKMSGELTHDRVEFNIGDAGLVGYLYSQGLISDDVNYFKHHPYLVQLKMDYILNSAANRINLEIDPNLSADVRQRVLLSSLLRANALEDSYFELEKLFNAIKNGGIRDVSQNLRAELLHPSTQLGSSDKMVVWHLLSNLNDKNPVLRYLFDKARFFSEYKTWSDGLQTWSVDSILNHRYIFQELIK